jgi:hypothetical protein
MRSQPMYFRPGRISACIRIVMLPKSQDSPTCFEQPRIRIPIPLDICRDLERPVTRVLPGYLVVLGATMPVATVDEDRDPCPAEYDVCGTTQVRERPYSNSVPHAFGMQEPTNGEFRSRVAAPIGLHVPPPPGRNRPGSIDCCRDLDPGHHVLAFNRFIIADHATVPP